MSKITPKSTATNGDQVKYKIGFDLDGVLATQSLALLGVLSKVEGMEYGKEWYYREAELKMDPKKFLGKNDEAVIVTARETIPKIVKITREWVDRHVGKHIPIIWVNRNVPPPIQLGGKVGNKGALDVMDRMAVAKAKVINREKIEVYFDDSEYLVKKLRKMCPKCKVIHFGARV
jgi:hypothetical protein